MRLISCSLTEPQVRAGTKDVTRRLGWLMLKPGDRLMFCRKIMGRKKGEPLVRIRAIKVTYVHRERLDLMITRPNYGKVECRREGIPNMTPFQKASIPPREVEGVIAAAKAQIAKDPAGYRKQWGFPPDAPTEEIVAFIRNLANEGDVYLNDTYQVNTRVVSALPGASWPPMIHLSIRRLDRAPVHDWRELQQIKNLIVGTDHEAVELYPAESRCVDTANQFHLWCIATAGVAFPFGFATGIKSTEPIGKSVQRPFAK